MRLFFASTCAFALTSFISASHPAAAADTTLTGEMSGFNAILGQTWHCSTSVPAMGGQPARTDHVTVAFDLAPGNVFHDHVVGPTYMGDDYFGYDRDAKVYWSTTADNHGAHGSETSSDGKVFTGTRVIGPMSMAVTTTYTRVNANNITLHEVVSTSGGQQSIDSNCTR